MTRLMQQVLQALLAALALAGPAMAQQIDVWGGGNITVGSTRQFGAYVPLSPATVHWSVNGVVGGSTTYGSISASGLYTAPREIPAANTIRVTATSTAYPSKRKTVQATITQVQPRVWSVSPATVAPGPFTLTVRGASFESNAVVRFGGVQLPTQRLSATQLTAQGSTQASQLGQSVTVDVLATGRGAISSDVLSVRVDNQPPPQLQVQLSPASASVAAGGTLRFTASVSGGGSAALTWSVNGVNGGNSSLGTISSSGVYTAPAVPPSPASVTVRATSVAQPTAYASASVQITGGTPPPPPTGPVDLAAARFLDQAAFGPTPNDLQRFKSLGAANWLAEQLAMAETPVPVPASGGNTLVAGQWLHRMSAAPDQLRQRVVYALSQFIVVSANKNPYAQETAPFLQILSRHAFGNYRNLLAEVTLSPQMGKYLDLANSNKPSAGSSANENYPRELLQLFSIGLVRLNLDGTTQLDAQGRPIPAYTQDEVQQLALALTGWTYAGSGNNNWENFSGPMVPRDVNHDMRAKRFLGCNLPASQGTVADLNAALDCVFQHPNVGPFVSLRLIRQMVKSNPSPAYVARVATVFNNNGSGVRGDLRAVVRSILTDAEARDDSTSPTGGRLRDPVQQITALVRSLGGSIPETHLMGWDLGRAGQALLSPASVFGFYSPLFRLPGNSTLAGPEFQIYTPTEAVLRGNLMYALISNPGGSATLNLAPYIAVAHNTQALVDKVDQALLYGRMPAGLRSIVAGQIEQMGSDAAARVHAALYFAALSGLHAVQH